MKATNDDVDDDENHNRPIKGWIGLNVPFLVTVWTWQWMSMAIVSVMEPDSVDIMFQTHDWPNSGPRQIVKYLNGNNKIANCF